MYPLFFKCVGVWVPLQGFKVISRSETDLLCPCFKFRMGSVLLKVVPEPTEAVRELLVHSLQRGNALERHNSKLEEENQRLIEEHQRITAE